MFCGLLNSGWLLFQRDQKAVGNFHANYFFFTAVHEAIFHVDGCSGIRSERPGSGKLDIAGAIKHMHMFPKQGAITGHDAILPASSQGFNSTPFGVFISKWCINALVNGGRQVRWARLRRSAPPPKLA